MGKRKTVVEVPATPPLPNLSPADTKKETAALSKKKVVEEKREKQAADLKNKVDAILDRIDKGLEGVPVRYIKDIAILAAAELACGNFDSGYIDGDTDGYELVTDAIVSKIVGGTRKEIAAMDRPVAGDFRFSDDYDRLRDTYSEEVVQLSIFAVRDALAKMVTGLAESPLSVRNVKGKKR